MDLHYLVNPTVETLAASSFLPSVPKSFRPVRHLSRTWSSGNHLEDGFRQIVIEKTRMILDAIEANPDGAIMVASDIDIVFIHDCVPELNRLARPFDLLFQRESDRPADQTCNTGFQVIRRNEANARFYRAALAIQQTEPESDDQIAINRLLQSFHAPHWSQLPLDFSAESNGGLRPGSLLYHANCTAGDSLRKKTRILGEIRSITTAQNRPSGESAPSPDRPVPFIEGFDSFREALQKEWDERGEEDHLWLVDEEAWLDGNWEDFFESFGGCDADFLAADIRVSFEDPQWPWWVTLSTPSGSPPPRGERLMAAFMPVVRFSIRALESVLQGLESGWSGHPEVVVPTLIRKAGWTLEDLGGAGSFTPAGRRNRWYRSDCWQWQGPIRHVPGKLHYPKAGLPFRPA